MAKELPEHFILNLESVIPNEIKEFTESLDKTGPTSIRINPKKRIAFELGEPVPWAKEGIYLKERIKFNHDPKFHAGTYYVQEAGSMLIEQAFKQYTHQNDQLKVLDLCASPGGKSTHLLTLMNDQSLLVTNEIIGARNKTLVQNIVQWGWPNVIVTQSDPKHFSKFSQKFDVVLVDAPCSGEGMFRKHDHAIDEWSSENVNLCAARQQRILHDVWSCLKKDGILIYSTCTFNLEENEKNLFSFLQDVNGQSLPLNLEKEWNILANEYQGIHGYRLMPHRNHSEGFFISILRKKDESTEHSTAIKAKTEKLFDWKKYILNANKFKGFVHQQSQFIFPEAYFDFFKHCQQELRITYAGTEIGEMKGKNFVPAHALAMSTELNNSAFNKIQVAYEEALSYLRKEPLRPKTNQTGIELVSYENQILGFQKNIGNRTNNLYPKNWRILH